MNLSFLNRKSTCRKFLLVFFIILIIAISSNRSIYAQTPVVGTNPVGWRVIWTYEPSTTATISWNTAQPSQVNKVTYWKDKSIEKIEVKTSRDGQYTSNKKTTKLFYHHAILKDLSPNTKYHIIMESDKKKSRRLYFITAADTDKPFSLICGGDSRSDRNARQKINRFIANHLEAEKILRVKNQVLALAHGGDYVASGRDLQQWKNWMSDYELTTTKAGRMLPIIPVRGNHDVGPLFNEIFNFAKKHQNYYGIVINKSLTIINLNSETTMAGSQSKWLNSALKYARPKYRWVIAQYHTPAYPAYKRPGGALQHFVPLFEKYNVDLVVESDGHTIKRTVPIRNGKLSADGIVYVGEGGLGVKPRVPKTDRWYLKDPGKAGSGHHIQLLSFSKKELKFQVMLLNQKIFDSYTRKPRQK